MTGLLALIGSKVLELLLPSLITAIAGLVAALLTRKLKQLGLELTAQQAKTLADLVADAIRAAEEAARRQPAMTSTAKRDLATAIIASRMPTLDRATIGQAIDASLPLVRLALTQTSKGPTVVAAPTR